MGFFDDVQSTFNRGVAATGRTARIVKLKSGLNDAIKRRQSFTAQLGASLYEVTREDAKLREGREGLYDAIAQIDIERERLQAEIDQLEHESEEQAQAATSVTCPFCGARLSAYDLFCSGCGKPMAEIQAALASSQPQSAPAVPAQQGPVCPSCGAPVSEGDMFCMSCGTRLGGEAPAENTAEESSQGATA